MNLLNQTIASVLSRQPMAPNISPPVRNRIDIDPSLLLHHETGLGPKPPPQPTAFLPLRTRLGAALLSDIGRAQTEAYYEEIDSIPAAALGLESAFSAGHWFVVHPVTYYQARAMNARVLQDLLAWIEEMWPNELFVGTKVQVRAFRLARDESVLEVRRELERRERRGEVGGEEGYTGSWEVLGDDGMGKGNQEEKKVEGNEEHERLMARMDPAALEAAREVGRRAADDARDNDEYEFLT